MVELYFGHEGPVLARDVGYGNVACGIVAADDGIWSFFVLIEVDFHVEQPREDYQVHCVAPTLFVLLGCTPDKVVLEMAVHRPIFSLPALGLHLCAHQCFEERHGSILVNPAEQRPHQTFILRPEQEH